MIRKLPPEFLPKDPSPYTSQLAAKSSLGRDTTCKDTLGAPKSLPILRMTGTNPRGREKHMSALIEPGQLAHENELVWLEDIGELDYVRQSLDRLPTRRGKPPYHRNGRMVGYVKLGSGARSSRASGTFVRRVFWLLPHDRDGQPDGLYASGVPSEAVDPRTIAPGVKGYQTHRCEGGPPSVAMRK